MGRRGRASAERKASTLTAPRQSVGSWLHQQGRSATYRRRREDVSAKIGCRAPNRRRTVQLREQQAASQGVARRREQGSRAASSVGQITPSGQQDGRSASQGDSSQGKAAAQGHGNGRATQSDDETRPRGRRFHTVSCQK